MRAASRRGQQPAPCGCPARRSPPTAPGDRRVGRAGRKGRRVGTIRVDCAPARRRPPPRAPRRSGGRGGGPPSGERRAYACSRRPRRRCRHACSRRRPSRCWTVSTCCATEGRPATPSYATNGLTHDFATSRRCCGSGTVSAAIPGSSRPPSAVATVATIGHGLHTACGTRRMPFGRASRSPTATGRSSGRYSALSLLARASAYPIPAPANDTGRTPRPRPTHRPHRSSRITRS